MIKAVIFDIDGVLLNSFEANLKFYQDLMVEAEYRPLTREEYLPYFHLSLVDAIKTFTKSSSEKEIKRIYNLGESRKVKYHTELLTMPKGAEKVVDALSKKYLLGIVTSRIKNNVYEAPMLAKLQRYFKVAVSNEDTVNHKPHPEPLLLACEILGVKPGQAVYVGDVENDITAGTAAGMKTILYSKTPLAKADLRTSSFTKLPKLIKSL